MALLPTKRSFATQDPGREDPMIPLKMTIIAYLRKGGQIQILGLTAFSLGASRNPDTSQFRVKFSGKVQINYGGIDENDQNPNKRA